MSDSVLFLTTNDIENPVRGCDRRSAQIRNHFAGHYDVRSISFQKDDPSGGTTNENSIRIPYPSSNLLAPFNPVVYWYLLQEWRTKEYDVVMASAIGSVVYGLVASILFQASFVVDLHNVDSQLSRQVGNYSRYLFTLVFGTLTLRRADIVVVTSNTDKKEFKQHIRKKSLVVANGFDRETFYVKEGNRKNRILFFGNMDYKPNQEAVKNIIDEIAPEVQKRLPEFEIHIAGPSSQAFEKRANDVNNIKVVGLIDDIASYIRESRVVIVPVKSGSGTRLKIIEALACGTLVVSTPKGAEGWPSSWENLIITDLSGFPKHIHEVINSGKFDMSEYDAITKYSWEEQINRLINKMETKRRTRE